MQSLGTWFSGGIDSVGLMVGLDLEGLQPKHSRINCLAKGICSPSTLYVKLSILLILKELILFYTVL